MLVTSQLCLLWFGVNFCMSHDFSSCLTSQLCLLCCDLTPINKHKCFLSLILFNYTWTKKGHHLCQCPVLEHENIGGGEVLPDYWGNTSLHEFAPMVMKRIEIIEKLYLFKALLKMVGKGVHPPHPPTGSAPGP